jgi:Domain of unknown function DUF11
MRVFRVLTPRRVWLATLATLAVVATSPLPASAAPPQSATTARSADISTAISPTGLRIEADRDVTVKFVATVTNHGPSWARNVVVTDTWGAWVRGVVGVTSSSPRVSCSGVTCTLAGMRPGISFTIAVTLQFLMIFPEKNVSFDTFTATSTTVDPNLSNNSATCDVVD